MSSLGPRMSLLSMSEYGVIASVYKVLGDRRIMCGISLTATEAAYVNAACAFFLAATWRPHNFPRQDKTDQPSHVVWMLGAECLTSSVSSSSSSSSAAASMTMVCGSRGHRRHQRHRQKANNVRSDAQGSTAFTTDLPITTTRRRCTQRAHLFFRLPKQGSRRTIASRRG